MYMLVACSSNQWCTRSIMPRMLLSSTTPVVSIGFQQMSYSVREDETMATVCFDVIGQLDRNISLTTTTIAITAAGENTVHM